MSKKLPMRKNIFFRFFQKFFSRFFVTRAFPPIGYILKMTYFRRFLRVTLFILPLLSFFFRNRILRVLILLRGQNITDARSDAVGKPAAFSMPAQTEGGMPMGKLLSPDQVKRIKSLVWKSCCNCDVSGNCLMLDDGESHRCVQLLSIYGIHCRFFLNNVLPIDRELYEQIQNQKER